MSRAIHVAPALLTFVGRVPLVLVIFAISTAANADILPGNFLSNPDVEVNQDGDAIPDHWTRRQAGSATAGWANANPSGGKRHLLLNDSSPTGMASWSTTVDVPFAVEELELQWSWAYEFTSNARDDHFLMSVEWFSAGEEIGHNDFIARESLPDYTLVNKIVVVPDDTDALRITFASGGPLQTMGTMYVDEISVSIPGAGAFGDLNGDGRLNDRDLDLLSTAQQQKANDDYFDLNGDRTVDFQDRVFWVEWLKLTYFGDANMDFRFDSTDLIQVFQAGEYEDDRIGNSVWSTGDWNGDFDFDSSDIILAFQQGGYDQGLRSSIAAVPEPGGWLTAIVGFASLAATFRRAVRVGPA
jgi:hypothetical protein